MVGVQAHDSRFCDIISRVKHVSRKIHYCTHDGMIVDALQRLGRSGFHGHSGLCA